MTVENSPRDAPFQDPGGPAPSVELGGGLAQTVEDLVAAHDLEHQEQGRALGAPRRGDADGVEDLAVLEALVGDELADAGLERLVLEGREALERVGELEQDLL